MKKIVLLFASVFFCSGVSAQSEGVFRRTVVDGQKRPMDYFDVLILDPADSALLFGAACLGGRLEVPNPPRKGIVTLRSLGFGDLSFAEDFARPASPDTLVMTAAAVAIGDVVVTAAVPAVAVSAGKTVVQVAGSALQHLAEIADILRRAPGLEADDSGITVAGRGEPLIFIDDRRSSYAELQLLQPSQIVSIEIDRNPSARYDAVCKSVVRVRTKRPQSKVSGQLFDFAYFARRFSNTAGAQVQIAGEKWVNYFTYSYSDATDHYFVDNTNAILLPGRELADTVSTDGLVMRRVHALLYGSTLDVGPRHRLSWQYAGQFRDNDSESRVQEREYRPGRPVDDLESHESQHSRRPSHAARLAYRFAIDSARVWTIEADYTYVRPEGSQTVLQFRPASGSTDRLDLGNRSRAGVFTVGSEFAAPLLGADLLVGVHYGRIDSKTFSAYGASTTDTRLASDNLSAYFTLGRKYSKWGWQAGLRGEFQNDRVRVDGVPLRDGWENTWFPSLRLHTTPELVRDFDFSLSYTSRVSRPSVSDLDPSVVYLNDMVTLRGNPLLRSSVIRSLGFSASFRQKLTLRVEVDFRSNPKLETGVLDDDGQGILFQPVNIDRSRFSDVDLVYSDRWGRFSMTLDAGMEFSHARIPYMDTTITVGKPAWYASASCDLEIGKSTYLTCGFKYYGRNYELMSTLEATNNLTVGITQYCFDRRLQLSLAGHDLLRGMSDRWSDRYGYYLTTQRSNRDYRYLRFAVRWFFNGHRLRYEQAGQSAEALRID